MRFFYPTGHYNEIHIIGDFNNWKKDIKLELNECVFSSLVSLSPGTEYEFKFYTEEGRIHAPNRPDIVYDGLYANNFRITLDNEGHILPYNPHGYFNLRSSLGNITIYEKHVILKTRKRLMTFFLIQLKLPKKSISLQDGGYQFISVLILILVGT